MLPNSQRNTNIGVGIGLVLQYASNEAVKDKLVGAAIALFLIGLGFFIWGCSSYAKGKGHSPYLGLLGILSLIGLIILALLPDKNK